LDLILDGSTCEHRARVPTQGDSLFHELIFCRSIHPKRRSNRRVLIGIVLERHFAGLQQDLQRSLQLLSMLSAACFRSNRSAPISTGFIVDVEDSSACRPCLTFVIPDT
jgi:hypothetical protein